MIIVAPRKGTAAEGKLSRFAPVSAQEAQEQASPTKVEGQAESKQERRETSRKGQKNRKAT